MARRATPAPTPTTGTSATAASGPLPIEIEVKAMADTVTHAEGSIQFLAGLGASTDRTTVLKSLKRCPDALVKTMCDVASRHGDKILTLPYDSATVLATLSYAQANEEVVTMLRNLADRIEEDRILRMQPIAEQTMTRLALLRATYRKAEGKDWRSEYAMLRATLPPRTKKAVTTPSPTATAPAAAPSATVTVPAPLPPPATGSIGGSSPGNTNR